MHGLGRVGMQGVDRCSHLVGRPGMVLMVPTRGKRKPAPTEARTSLGYVLDMCPLLIAP